MTTPLADNFVQCERWDDMYFSREKRVLTNDYCSMFFLMTDHLAADQISVFKRVN